jgi:hypothetical protein
VATSTGTEREQESTMNERSGQETRATRKAWRLLALTTVVTMGVVGVGMGTASAAKPATPVKAAIAGTVTPGPTEGTFELSGTAASPQLGVADYDGVVTVTGLDPDTGTITDVLVETFTTANGDTITLRCDQTAVPVSPGVYQGSDTWTVIGGTGKYAGATGSGTGITYVDLNEGTFAKVLTGRISTGG